MGNDKPPLDSLIVSLKERAKELNCLYKVEELFVKSDTTLPAIMKGIVEAIPDGWQYSNICVARIVFGEETYSSAGFVESPWVQGVDLVVQDEVVGRLAVYYREERPPSDEGPFLKEERKLIDTIADRLERRILHERLREVFEDQQMKEEEAGTWGVILDLLRKTDAPLLSRISRKMLNYLSWANIAEGTSLLERLHPAAENDEASASQQNRPARRGLGHDTLAPSEEIFRIAARYLHDREIFNLLQDWILEDRSNFFAKILEDPEASLATIISAIERFHHLAPPEHHLPSARKQGFRVALIRRLLQDDPNFITVAKEAVEIEDFYDLLHHIIFPTGSRGKLGGKGAGLFLANQILRKLGRENPVLASVKTPKTWYLTSDGILNFIRQNDLEEIVEQKYEETDRVRQAYPYIMHVFRNSTFPPEIVNGLSAAIDDLGDVPLIVRSSSLLEDRIGMSFAGKYKSLFIPNQGSKQERLAALVHAITEVYASTFSPDAIRYRLEHGALDLHEEMGILVQEVVGRRVGDYFFPAFAGVGFSINDLRWSPRIRREDGLLRMVPGLGTRAVDRVSEDYPILLAPKQPNLRVNVTIDEKIRYSPKKIDLMNLATGTFETIDLTALYRSCGGKIPLLPQLASVVRDERLVGPVNAGVDFEHDFLVMTFDGLIEQGGVIGQIRAVLEALRNEMRMPVDIEFAHDGRDLYLLQCRSQSAPESAIPGTIPRNLPAEHVLFSARRYVTNGTVSNIRYVVYIDPVKYGELGDLQSLAAVGRVVGRLNQLLPRRQFILMGPGRWGSRGDIRLGVSVSYADISNTAMLIEIARKQREYMPELSFGTHFFQDLVEGSIRYLPLYPEDTGVAFNEAFFANAANILPDLLPDQRALAGTVRVIDVARAGHGNILEVRMDGEHDEAVGFLTPPVVEPVSAVPRPAMPYAQRPLDDSHWRWRLTVAEQLAGFLDPGRFGVKALYLIGSTKNAMAGPASDIDLLVHFIGNDAQRSELLAWLEGWSLCLAEINYLRTGCKTEGLLDVHIVTDEDIRNRSGHASKIGSATDAPRPLPLKSQGGSRPHSTWNLSG